MSRRIFVLKTEIKRLFSDLAPKPSVEFQKTNQTYDEPIRNKYRSNIHGVYIAFNPPESIRFKRNRRRRDRGNPGSMHICDKEISVYRPGFPDLV